MDKKVSVITIPHLIKINTTSLIFTLIYFSYLFNYKKLVYTFKLFNIISWLFSKKLKNVFNKSCI